jgi:hypothetical protein
VPSIRTGGLRLEPVTIRGDTNPTCHRPRLQQTECSVRRIAFISSTLALSFSSTYERLCSVEKLKKIVTKKQAITAPVRICSGGTPQ